MGKLFCAILVAVLLVSSSVSVSAENCSERCDPLYTAGEVSQVGLMDCQTISDEDWLPVGWPCPAVEFTFPTDAGCKLSGESVDEGGFTCKSKVFLGFGKRYRCGEQEGSCLLSAPVLMMVTELVCTPC